MQSQQDRNLANALEMEESLLGLAFMASILTHPFWLKGLQYKMSLTRFRVNSFHLRSTTLIWGR